MTENLAARGEGLAGLRERIVAAMKRAWPKTKVRSYNGVILELEKLCREIALEAAPAGTAPDVLREIAHIAGAPEGAVPSLWPSARRERLDQIAKVARAALATPSPQAPPTLKQLEEIMLDLKKRGFDHLNVGSCSLMELHKQLFEQCNAFSTTSAREQSPATAANNPSTGDMRAILDHCWRIIEETQQDTGRFGAIRGSARKIMSFGLPGNNPLRIVEVTPLTEDTKLWLNGKKVPAATQEQEQPAGSEASEPSVGDLVVVPARVIGVKPYLRVVVDGTEPNTPSALVMKPGFVRALNDWHGGSPRKVGEGGPAAQEIRLGVHLQHCNFGEYPNACKYGDDDCPALTESWSWFGKALERAARSSSVPVGEQKQEEGV